MIKKISFLLILTFLSFFKNSAVELNVTNDISDILNSKKICLRLNLNSTDQAIYRNSLNFSLDSPSISIASWTVNQNPSIQYITNFKRTKKVYTESLNCELLLNFDSEDKNTNLKKLGDASIYASCLVLDKNGKSNPVNLVKALDDGFSIVDTMTLNNALNIDTLKTFTSDFLKNKNLKYLSAPPKPPRSTDNLIIDNLRDIWNILGSKLKSFFMSLGYIVIYIIIFILIILMLLYRSRTINPWVIELRRFFIICWILWTYSFFSFVMAQHIFFIGFAILITPFSLYYIFTARTETTIDKFKSFIGFALAMSILPILIKAYISLKFY